MSNKKRPSAADALGDIFPPTVESKPDHAPDSDSPKAKTAHQKYGKPTTYRLPVELIKHLKIIAKQEQVGISDLAAFALKDFVDRYEAGDITLPKTKDVSYKINL